MITLLHVQLFDMKRFQSHLTSELNPADQIVYIPVHQKAHLHGVVKDEAHQSPAVESLAVFPIG
jgi:hypothetical protein